MRKKTGKENFRKRKERSKERQTEKRMIKNEIDNRRGYNARVSRENAVRRIIEIMKRKVNTCQGFAKCIKDR